MWLLLEQRFSRPEVLGLLAQCGENHHCWVYSSALLSSHAELPRVTSLLEVLCSSVCYFCLFPPIWSPLLTTYCHLDAPHSLHKEGQGSDDLNGLRVTTVPHQPCLLFTQQHLGVAKKQFFCKDLLCIWRVELHLNLGELNFVFGR